MNEIREVRSVYQGDYFHERMARYLKIPYRHQYTDDEILRAYKNWSSLEPGFRDEAWDTYCDARDSMPLGINARIRMDFEKSPARNLGVH